EIIERAPLVEERSLRGIQILGARFGIHRTGPESDDPSLAVGYWKDYPAEEIVSQLVSDFRTLGQAASDELLIADPLFRQGPPKRPATIGCKAEPEALDGLGRQAARFQIGACGRALF